MPARLTIEDMKSFARLYGGKCLSKEYINKNTSLEWICKRGHRWDNPYAVVRNGIWCPQCVKDTGLFKLQEMAEEKGGKCLSDTYKGTVAKYKWCCKEGHVFTFLAVWVKAGGWCPTCRVDEQNEQRLKKLKIYAQKRGGSVLSEKYSNLRTRLTWKCAEGHTWKAPPLIVYSKSWCRACAVKKRKKPIDELHKIAKENGGKLLSDSADYSHSESKLKWQCEQGHIWIGTPHRIKSGRWCGRCSDNKRNSKRRRTYFDILKKLALSKKGILLSQVTDFHNSQSKLKWQCYKGHIWLTDAKTVKKGAWCPKCASEKWAKKNRTPFEVLQDIGRKKNGKLLSSENEYRNVYSRLYWRCSEGHTWKAITKNIKQGAWCPTCANERKSQQKIIPFSTLEKLAKDRGGRLLSDAGKPRHKKSQLKWQCKKGHVWETTMQIVRGGSWCPICAKEERGRKLRTPIKSLRQLARLKGGRLLSNDTDYVDRHSRLKWQCKKKHIWESVPRNITAGYWCTICGHNARITKMKSKS